MVANDDGIFSPGIKALALALSSLAQVYVVAPDAEQSGVGHGITFRRPLRFTHTAAAGLGDLPAYRVDGTPADCVVLGVSLLGRPDLVVSGINLGANLGHDLTRSGTVAVAIEGTQLGIPSIAISLRSSNGEFDFAPAASYAVQLASWVLQHGLPKRTLFNVNVPEDHEIGVSLTALSDHRYRDEIVEHIDPEGRPYYWVTGRPGAEHLEGTDFGAVEAGRISVTPIRLDLTDHRALSDLTGQLPPYPR